MKILFGILVVLTIVASFFADYKWRQWMTHRPKDEDVSAGTRPNHDRDRQ